MNLTIVRRRIGTEHTVLFDAEDEAMVRSHRWHVKPGGNDNLLYAVTTIRNSAGDLKARTMHVLLMGMVGIDHENHNGLDNRRSNLRPANQSQNMGNRRPTPGGASVYKGVDNNRGRWRARIKVDGHARSLGHYGSEIEAAMAYDDAALEAWGSYACLNLSRSQAS